MPGEEGSGAGDGDPADPDSGFTDVYPSFTESDAVVFGFGDRVAVEWDFGDGFRLTVTKSTLQ